MAKQKVSTTIKKLSLQKGDILVIQRGYQDTTYWTETLQDAGREAGINFNVPIIYVDDIDHIAVVRMGENSDGVQ